MWYDTKKNETNHIAQEPRVGRDRQTAKECVLTCHSVTRLSLIALLSTSGCIFKHRRVFILGRKMSDCKSERVNIKFLVRLKKFVTETFQFWLRITVKTACLMHMCLNGTNDFQKAEKASEMMIAQAVHAQLLPITTLKKCKMWFKKSEGWVFGQ